MKKITLLSITAIALVVFFNGCKKDDHEATEFLCPVVVSTIPVDKAIDVPLNQIISATFNEEMDPATINQESFIIEQGGTSIAGPVTYSGLTANFTPSSPLLPDVLYSGTIKTLAKDFIGQSLMEDYNWSFTTIAEVTLSSNPAAGGTVSGEGTFDKGSSVNVTATPNEGYSFVNWSLNETPVSTNPDYQFTMDGNKALVANFTLQLVVGLSSNPAEGGTTNGDGVYDSGESVTISAEASEGYSFTNWTEGTDVVSENANYTFTITGNRELVANFTENPPEQFIVDLSSSPAEGGTTIGDGTYDMDASVIVTAEASEGYSFTNWTEGTDVVSENANYTFTITGNRELVANFTENAAEQFIVELSANPAEGGTTTGGGTYDSGASVTATAEANVGYSFSNWTEGTDIVSENANYTFTITDNRELVANFTENPPEQFIVELSGSPAEGGTTTGDGTYDMDESVTISANASEGYSFTNWTEGTDVVSENADYTFTITDNRELVANFTENPPDQFIVDLSANPAEGGTTTGGGTYDSGASVTATAEANVGYSFTNWTEGTDVVSENADYTFTITGNRELVANFTEDAPAGPAAIDLGTAGDFSILAKSGISTTGVTSVQGDIGVSPAAATAITGFELIMDTDGQSSHTTVETLVTGKVYASDYAPPTPSMLTTAIGDMETAYTTANNLVTPAPVLEEGAGNISGLTLAPGLYKWSTEVLIDPDASVTLSGGENDTWVFQIAQDLTLMSKAQVKLLGGAQAKNITWVVAGQAVLGTESVLVGTILSKTLISLNTGATVTGRLLAQTAVTLNASTVVKP
jgi:hypothetical protein